MKMDIVKQKLDLGNPVSIMVQELEANRTRVARQSFTENKEAVIGGRGTLRRTLAKKCASANEQVCALVELATDPNVLGRTYIGWLPHF